MRKMYLFKSMFFVATASALSYAAYEKMHRNNSISVSPLLEENIAALTDGDQTSYRYPDLAGKPKECTLYKYFNAKTGATIKLEEENKSFTAELGWTYEKKDGVKDLCPRKGSGCNPYSCQEISYNAGSGL